MLAATPVGELLAWYGTAPRWAVPQQQQHRFCLLRHYQLFTVQPHGYDMVQGSSGKAEGWVTSSAETEEDPVLWAADTSTGWGICDESTCQQYGLARTYHHKVTT